MRQLTFYGRRVQRLFDSPSYRARAQALVDASDGDSQIIGRLALAALGEAPEDQALLGVVPEDEGPLVRYARDELTRAGMLDEDSDYGGELGDTLLQTIRMFSTYGHSGSSVEAATSILEHLLRHKPLTPLTNAPEEWRDQGDASPEPTWQSVRNPSVFSRDGGQTWYDIDDAGNNNGDVWDRTSWEPVVLGYIESGDRVRVDPGAYYGPRGFEHNGKLGRVVGTRNGKVIVKYESDDTDILGHHHEPSKLQKRKSDAL